MDLIEMNKEQQELLDKAYENYLNKAKNYTTEDLFYNKLSGVGDIIEGMLSAYTRDFIPYSKEEFINKCKTNPEFSERWGLKIEERIVLEQVDQNNPVLKGSTALWSTKLITITYNDKTIESYE